MLALRTGKHGDSTARTHAQAQECLRIVSVMEKKLIRVRHEGGGRRMTRAELGAGSRLLAARFHGLADLEAAERTSVPIRRLLPILSKLAPGARTVDASNEGRCRNKVCQGGGRRTAISLRRSPGDQPVCVRRGWDNRSRRAQVRAQTKSRSDMPTARRRKDKPDFAGRCPLSGSHSSYEKANRI